MVEYEKLEPWKGKYATILAVNCDIGITVSEKLLKMNMLVIGVDSDENNIKILRQHEKFKFIRADLKNEDHIQDIFQIIEKDYGGAEMLVNIMKVSKTTSFLDGDTQDWRGTMSQHVVGYVLSVREMLRSMADRKVELGQIVNIVNFSDSDISDKSQYRLYLSLKRIVNMLTKRLEKEVTLRMDHVRISSISNAKENLEDKQRRNSVNPSHYADALQYVISMPLHVQIQNVELGAC